jgi:NADPH-dependent 2,4-dienoyl-CoA reductase/sulfur reductase-like enzyme
MSLNVEGFFMADVLVIGAGVVGLAVARELAVLGYQVVVAEKDTHIGGGVILPTTPCPFFAVWQAYCRHRRRPSCGPGCVVRQGTSQWR